MRAARDARLARSVLYSRQIAGHSRSRGVDRYSEDMKNEEDGKVVLMLHLWPHQGESAAVYQSLKMIEGPTRARRGCRFFGAFRSCVGPPELVLLEEWDTRDAMEGHVRSRDFRVVLAAMDASTRQPSFRVDTVESSEGFECVAGILGDRPR